MEVKPNHIKLPLKLNLKDFNCVSPETQCSNKAESSKGLTKHNNLIVLKKTNTDLEWNAGKKALKKSKGPLLSKSTILNLVYADKEEKRSSDASNHKKSFSTYSQNLLHIQTPLNDQPIKIAANAKDINNSESFSHIIFDTNDINNSNALSNSTKSHIFSKIKPSFKLKKQRKSECKVEVINREEIVKYMIASKMHKPKGWSVLRTTVPIRRLLGNKIQKVKEIVEASYKFPKIPLPMRNLEKNHLKNMQVKKNFTALKDLPLYRIAVENNMILRLKHCKGRLK